MITCEFFAPPGQSLTLLVCAYGTYTPANGAGDAATETARAGVYTATIGEALSGWHTAHIVAAAGWELPIGDVYLVAGATCRVRSAAPGYASAISVPTGPVDPTWADVYADVYDEAGEALAGVVCSLRIAKEPAGSGQIYGGAIAEETSDANGRVRWPKRPVGATIEYWRGPADADPKRLKRATIQQADVVDGVYWLPRIVGHQDLEE
jgi:hypothetical protein